MFLFYLIKTLIIGRKTDNMQIFYFLKKYLIEFIFNEILYNDFLW